MSLLCPNRGGLGPGAGTIGGNPQQVCQVSYAVLQGAAPSGTTGGCPCTDKGTLSVRIFNFVVTCFYGIPIKAGLQ